MRNHGRLLAAVLVVATVVLTGLVARGSGTDGAQTATPAPGVARHASSLRERERGEASGGAEGEAYADRAYPAPRSRSTRSRARSRPTTL